MRLARLDLTRYGKFTNQRIDFGRAEPGQPDLHIIYGPNEAGKSTTLSAFLDLLFGIEIQSGYGFRHPYATMEIGGLLETGGALRELVRRKKRHNSLLDGAGQPVAEAAVLGELGQIDRETYRAMFSLDDDTLEAGGKDIMASKGDFGQLLFAASTGLAGLSQSLLQLREEAERFFKLNARSSELNELKKSLADLKNAKDNIDTAASAHAQLLEARDRATAQHADQLAARTATNIQLQAIQRQLHALPRLIQLRQLRAELALAPELPAPPATWVQELPQLLRQDTQLATQQDTNRAQAARLAAEIAAITIDDVALAVADRLDGMKLARGRYETAEKDIPLRRQELQQTDLEIAGILRQLGRDPVTDPESLLLGATTTGELRALIERRSGIETALATARHELTQAEQLLAAAQAAFNPAEPAPVSTAALEQALSPSQQDDHEARRRTAERSRAHHQEILSERLRQLAPWHGSADQLAELVVPHASDVAAWKQAEAETQNQIARLGDEIAGHQGEIRRLTAEQQAISATAGVTGDQQAGAVRAAREQAWAQHKTRLDAASAQAFEATLRQDDIATNAQLLHARELAQLHQIAHARAVAAANLGHATDRHQAATAHLQDNREKLSAVIAAFLPPDTSLSRLEAWIAARDRALETRDNLRQAERDLREAQSDAQAARDRLRQALAAAGVAHDETAGIGSLREIATAALKLASDRATAQHQFKERAQLLAIRQRDYGRAQTAEQTWQTAWDGICASCWLGAATLASVREILPLLAKLGPALEKRALLVRRIEDMATDKASFAAQIAEIASALGLGPDASVTQIDARTAKLRSDQSVRNAKLATLEATQREGHDLVAQITRHQQQAAIMTSFFGVLSLPEVAQKLQAYGQQTSLQQQIAHLERDICAELACPAIAQAEAALDQADQLALQAEQTVLEGQRDDQDHLVQELFAARRSAEAKLEAVGGDGAVARIEEQRRTILLEIEDHALRYLRLRLGIAAAERALRLYREQHRSSMMQHASEAFKTISRGAYARLSTQPEKDSENLIGIDAEGGSKIVLGMSKGTRFQLYLALRVAGYHEFARTRRPVPFIADDIMETFDDFRAEEAFRLFAGMALTGQVIYLTHHRHLCEIASRICPGVKLHEL